MLDPSAQPRPHHGVPFPNPRLEEIRSASDLLERWNQVDVLLLPRQRARRYLIGYAASDACSEAVQRLRYQVFNVELKEGLFSSHATGLDRDRYDDQMTHIVLMDRETHCIVGTYRCQTITHALRHAGIYSAAEFDLGPIDHLMDRSIETGRACIEQHHRGFAALLSLWTALIAFLKIHEHRWLFGCCSITSIDPDDGWRALKTLRRLDYLHPELHVPAQEAYSCGSPEREHAPDLGPEITLPKLFNAYMRLGAFIVSEPALDREFGTVDFLCIMDVMDMNLSSLVPSNL